MAKTAPGLAMKILESDCGNYDKCIVITHSMGGLVFEHMMTHASDDPNNLLNKKLVDASKAALYNAVREKVLFAVSLASAAGGSRAANIINDPGDYSLGKYIVGKLASLMGNKEDADKDLVVQTASNVIAPIKADPGVPIFMVAGYSDELVTKRTKLAELAIGIGRVKDDEFNGNEDFALYDGVTEFKSRSDGLVGFRSSCGIASSNEKDGPGHKAELSFQFEYCFQGRRKPNHFMWFMANLNHENIKSHSSYCASHDCTYRFSDPVMGLGIVRVDLRRKSPAEIIGDWLSVD